MVGEGKPIRLMIESNQPASMILWGPPGVGKTTLALLIANLVKAEYVELSAISSGVKEVRAAIEAEFNQKQKGKQTILFIDEIHRFNKAQQDSLLQSSEKGMIILIGATTENPSFEVIAPSFLPKQGICFGGIIERRFLSDYFKCVNQDEVSRK